MPPVSRVAPLFQIQDQLPAGSRYHRSSGHPQTCKVLLLAGPLALDELDLGSLPLTDAEGAGSDVEIDLVLVQDDLQVHGPIHAHQLHDMPGLMVLGNLRAHSVIVGSQEIHVTGSLQVETLFWGSDYGGSLQVHGNATAQVWMATDEFTLHLPDHAQGLR